MLLFKGQKSSFLGNLFSSSLSDAVSISIILEGFVDNLRMNQYKKYCSFFDFFRMLCFVAPQKTIQSTNLSTKTYSDYEFSNHTKIRRYQLYTQTSSKCSSPRKIINVLRSSWAGLKQSKFRWNEFNGMQIGRVQSIQLQFRKCNSRQSLSMESQSQFLKSQRSIVDWNRFGMVQFGRFHSTQSQYSTCDSSASIPLQQGDQ